MKDFSLEIFEKIKTLVFEARDQGYSFNIDYSPNLFIEERIMGKDLEKEFCSMSEWKDVQIILTMIKQSEINKWDFIRPHFEELKKQHLRPITLQYAINSSKQYGPFFVTSMEQNFIIDPVTIYTFFIGKKNELLLESEVVSSSAWIKETNSALDSGFIWPNVDSYLMMGFRPDMVLIMETITNTNLIDPIMNIKIKAF